MKLLICTQAVDKNHPILGFFHRWIEEFAKHFEEVHVICLLQGEFSLPSNVYVYSLGKEEGESRLRYIWRFYTYAWRLRNKHQVVFVHMNPHYIVMAGWFWVLTKKKIFFWRNHKRMNLMTHIAAFFAKNVFYTSPFACTSRYSHSIKMPVGIDTDTFVPSATIEKERKSVLFLGRLSPVKRPELLLEAAKYMSGFKVYFYGNDSNSSKEYELKLKSNASSNVMFHDSVVNTKTPEIYNRYEVYMNLTPEGSMDKTILEATSCGTLVLVSNKSFEGILPEECLIYDESPQAIATKVSILSGLSEEIKKQYSDKLRELVIREHSLKRLMDDFVKYI